MEWRVAAQELFASRGGAWDMAACNAAGDAAALARASFLLTEAPDPEDCAACDRLHDCVYVSVAFPAGA